jgi:hypothetical protein
MITSGQIAIGTTPTLIDGTFNSNFRLTIQNMDNTDTVYLGNSDVSISNGLGLLKEASLQIELNPMEQLYAVSSKAGHVISWMKQV